MFGCTYSKPNILWLNFHAALPVVCRHISSKKQQEKTIAFDAVLDHGVDNQLPVREPKENTKKQPCYFNDNTTIATSVYKPPRVLLSKRLHIPLWQHYPALQSLPSIPTPMQGRPQEAGPQQSSLF